MGPPFSIAFSWFICRAVKYGLWSIYHDISIVFMEFINQLGYRLEAPHCTKMAGFAPSKPVDMVTSSHTGMSPVDDHLTTIPGLSVCFKNMSTLW